MPAEVVSIYLVKKVLDKIEDKFVSGVIQRWHNYRARRFLETLAEAFAAEALNAAGEEEKVDTLLDDLFESGAKTEAMYDAYRRVVLTASKELGPRIIALLTTRLLVQNRYASADEEIVFRAAETFTDDELRSFTAHLPNPTEPQHEATDDGGLRYHVHTESIKPTSVFKEHTSIGPLNLSKRLGPWAPKAVQIGLLSEEIRERNRPSRHPSPKDDPTEREIEWFLTFTPPSRLLVELVRRADRAMSG